MKQYLYPALLACTLALGSVACQKHVIELPAPAVTQENELSLSTITGPNGSVNPDGRVTTITQDGNTTLQLHLGNPNANINLVADPKTNQNLLSRYGEIYGAGALELLPAENYKLTLGEEKGAERTIQVEISGYNKLPYGFFLLPVVLKADNQEVIHFVKVAKEGDFVPLSDANPKPLPKGGSQTQPMRAVAYVETNDYDIRNFANLVLKESRKPVFDIVVLFAANMNYDATKGKRYIHFNDKLQPIVKNPERYIKPLTDRGIKVIIDILPNHDGVGYANFQSYEEAQEFAQEMKMWTDKLGIDGWDIDEEYADYWKRSDMPSNPKSWLWFARAVKEAMPNKLLTLYDYAHSYRDSRKDDQGKAPKDYIDYSWSNYYEDHGSFAGLPNSRYGKQSIEANHGLIPAMIKRVAQNNVKGGFGFMMFFNINPRALYWGGAISAMNEMTQVFWGEDCEYVGPYYKGYKDQ